MENYICINGKKAELTKEQMKALGIELPKKPSPFDRVCENQYFYYIGSDGNVGLTRECYNGFDTSCYRYGNYCTDKSLMEQRAHHENLNRLLWRYSMEHDGDKINLNNTTVFKYGIKRMAGRSWTTFPTNAKLFGVPLFATESIAQNAIKEIVDPFMKAHPEFKW